MILDAAPTAIHQAPMRFASAVEAPSRVVTLAALADLSELPADVGRQAGALPILKIPEGRDRLVVSSARLRARVAALAPALKPWLAGDDAEIVVRYVRPTAAAARPGQACVKVLAPLAADAVPTSRDLEPAPCAGALVEAFWADRRAGVVRARRALQAGEILHAPPRSMTAGVASGDWLVLEARVGPVTVQRRVQALQPARPGERLFVKASDGAVISIPYPSTAQ